MMALGIVFQAALLAPDCVPRYLHIKKIQQCIRLLDHMHLTYLHLTHLHLTSTCFEVNDTATLVRNFHIMRIPSEDIIAWLRENLGQVCDAKLCYLSTVPPTSCPLLFHMVLHLPESMLPPLQNNKSCQLSRKDRT